MDIDYVLRKARDGQARAVCPACGPMRRNKNDLSLSIKRDSKGVVYQCWHCGESGLIPENDMNKPLYKPETRAEIIPIKPIAADDLDFGGIEYLTQRGIPEAIAREAGVCSGVKFFSRSGSKLEAVGFPYRHNDRTIAIKWRSITGKDFTQDGSAQTLFLADKIQPGDDVVICEGELDSLSFWTAGIKAVSIPSGAISENIADDSARLKWLGHHQELIEKAKNVYLAVDMDGPGETTANELARRIGKLKCWRVRFRHGCKDANDVLLKHGAEALAQAFKDAERWPLEGLATPSDYLDKVQALYRDGLPRGASTGLPSVDEIFTLNPGSLVIVTGTPGSGKSQLIDNILINAMIASDWRVAYASFENPPELHLPKLISLRAGKPFGEGPTPRIGEGEMLETLAWINERVTFLTNEGVMPTVESLIERFEAAVLRSGVKACVVDPVNFIKLHQKPGGGADTESINDMLAQFKTFAQRAEVTFFLVAHPAKPMNVSNDWVPNGYSISGSAHYYNRADFGLTVQRKVEENILHVWKCRFPWQGGLGQASLKYDKTTGRFYESTGNDAAKDLSWLEGFDKDYNY